MNPSGYVKMPDIKLPMIILYKVKERLLFLFYLIVLIFLSFLRVCLPLLVVFLLCLPFIKLKRLGPVLLLFLIVSVPYLAIGYIGGESRLYWFGLFNLRALSMLTLTMAFFSRINPFKALAFSKTLSWVLSLSYSQYISFTRNYRKFSLALKSRTIKKLLGKTLRSYIGSVFSFFVDFSEKRAKEIDQALESRGFHA